MTSQISRRSFLGTAAALAASSDRPNVLFYFADQVRACEMGYAGG